MKRPCEMSDLLRFCFDLDAVEHIVPWGEPGGQRLHWFGLTSGTYWIETNAGDALTYTAEAENWRIFRPRASTTKLRGGLRIWRNAYQTFSKPYPQILPRLSVIPPGYVAPHFGERRQLTIRTP